MSVKDFDEKTGKLVDVSKIRDDFEAANRGPNAVEFTAALVAREKAAASQPVPDPLGMKPSGSTPLRYNFIDGFRTLMTGFSIYGAAQAVLHFLTFAGLVGPAFLPRYAAEIAAFTACGCHLASAILADNTPRS